jgi:xylulokinase
MPVELIEADEGAAYGAALLAGVGTENWPSVEAACETAVRVAKRVQPNPKIAAQMNLQYAEYQKLYPSLRGIRHAF